MSAANAACVDAVCVPGAGEARARAARIQGLAARMRDLGAIDDPRRWNALVAGASAEIAADDLLHRRAALNTAQAAMESPRSRIVAAATSVPDVRPTRAAETGAPGASEERAPAGNVAPDRSAEAARPGNDDAFGNDTAVAEVGPADDFAVWVRALTAGARAAEQAAADAEAAAGDSGRSRASSCSDAEARVAAAAARVSSLTVGDDRPRFVSVRTGREAYSDLFHLLDAAQRRARAVCRSIGR